MRKAREPPKEKNARYTYLEKMNRKIAVTLAAYRLMN